MHTRRIELIDSIESFRAWKTFIRNYLSGKNLLCFIEVKTNNEAASGNQDEAKVDDQAVMKQKNEARSILFKSIHPTLFQLFEDEDEYPLNDPLKLYQGIVAHFEIVSMTNKNHLRTQLYQSKMKPNESVDNYVSRIQQLVRSLKSIDSKWNPNDEDLTYFILNGLSESFKPIKLIIENDNALSMNTIILKLRQYQESESWSSAKHSSSNKNKHASIEEDGVSYYNQDSNRNYSNSKSFGSNQQRINNNRSNQQGNRSNSARTCYTCGDAAHMAYDCPRNANAIKCANCRYIGGHRTEECRKPPRNRSNGANNQSSAIKQSSNSDFKNQDASSIKNNYAMKK